MINVTDLLISQYYRAEKIRKILQAFEDVLETNVASQLPYMKNQMGIKADGVFLDLLGKRFGLERPMVPEGGKFFGFVEWEEPDGSDTTPTAPTTNKGSFSAAPFVPDRQGENAGKQEATDSAYRKLLMLRGASLVSQHTQDEINAVLESALAGSFVVDNQDMTGTLYIAVNAGTIDGDVIINNTEVIPRPVGVHYEIEHFRYFGFSSEDATFSDATRDNGPMLSGRLL